MDFYGFGIDFYQIWYVFNLPIQVLGPFFMVLGLFFSLFRLDLFRVQNQLSRAGVSSGPDSGPGFGC